MTVRIIVLVLGVILFLYGYFKLMRSGREQRDYRVYGSCAYLGAGLSALGLILLMEGYLSRFHPLWILAAMMALMMAAARKLVTPGFRRK